MLQPNLVVMRNGATVPHIIETAPAMIRIPEAPCPFCGNFASEMFCRTLSEDGTHHNFAGCTKCGTTFLWPPPSEAQLQKAYASNYYGEGETKFNGSIERLRDASAIFRFKNMAKRLPRDASILDVGCGDGRLLGCFSKAGFRQLHGIEPPGRAAERAAKIPGINLHLGTLATVDLAPASFDLITLVHVYEHLPAPRETLDRLARSIRTGGRLFLSFPNISSWQARFAGGHWFHLDPPRHLSLVPPKTVITHLEANGFKLVSQQHLCLEQNTYGWIQSILNRCDNARNFLYERLKRNRTYMPERGAVNLLLHAAAGGLLVVPAIIADLFSAMANSGATVELMFEKTTVP